MLLVHPEGEGSKVDNKALNISFAPSPDYSGIAKAASGGTAWAGGAGTVDQLKALLPEAVAAVQSGICAVLDAHLGMLLVPSEERMPLETSRNLAYVSRCRWVRRQICRSKYFFCELMGSSAKLARLGCSKANFTCGWICCDTEITTFVHLELSIFCNRIVVFPKMAFLAMVGSSCTTVKAETRRPTF